MNTYFFIGTFLFGVVVAFAFGYTFRGWRGRARYPIGKQAEKPFLGCLVVMMDDEGRIVNPDPGWEQLTGQGWPAHKGHGWVDQVFREDIPHVREIWSTCRKDQPETFYEFRLFSKTHQTHRYVQALPVPALSGHVGDSGQVWVFADIHEQKIAAKRREAALDQAPHSVLMIDQGGRIRMVNHQFTLVFGYAEEEIIGKPLETLLPYDKRVEHKNDVTEYFLSPRVRPMGRGRILEGIRKDGRRLSLEIGLAPVSASGETLVMASIIDLSNWHDALTKLAFRTRELEESKAEMEQFTYVASHDLQEPLRVVGSFAELLQARYANQIDERGVDYIQRMVRAVERMKTLINDLLILSRVGRADTLSKRIPISKSIEMALENLQRLIAETRAVVTVDSELPVVEGNAAALSHVFQNLIHNAIKFGAEADPKVHIGFRHIEERGEWEFSVRDNGIGIDPMFHDKIFTLFQRLHPREEYPGSGVGLTICRKIVERHRGRIWVESTLKRGSTFYFTIAG